MKKLLGRSQVLDGTQQTVFSVSRGIFWKASTRILAIYAISILAFVGTSIPIFQQILFRSVDERVEENLQEDFEGFVEYFDAWQAEVEPNADNLKGPSGSRVISLRPRPQGTGLACYQASGSSKSRTNHSSRMDLLMTKQM